MYPHHLIKSTLFFKHTILITGIPSGSATILHLAINKKNKLIRGNYYEEK